MSDFFTCYSTTEEYISQVSIFTLAGIFLNELNNLLILEILYKILL
jgi:hypothetical protein